MRFVLNLTVACCCCLQLGMAQSPVKNDRVTIGRDRLAAFQQQKMMLARSPYKAATWELTGPDIISGRCTDVWGIAGDTNTLYAAFATGGLWKTIDAGKK
jgi:hypothetical protein